MKKFFYPDSMVVVGVSITKINLGRIILLSNLQQGYEGRLYGVGARDGEVDGVKVYPGIEQLPEIPDVAILITPAKTIPDELEKCGKKGINRVVIESGGFSEFSSDETDLEKEVLAIAQRYGIKIIGPNCIGTVNFEKHMMMPFAFFKKVNKTGNVSLISQSGGVGNTYLHGLPENHIFLAKFASVGNKLDLDEVDFLEYFLEDPKTEIIVCYLEGFSRGRDFYNLAMNSQKPVIVHKSNRSPESASIAQSHTTALSAGDDVVDAALSQSAVIRAEDEDEVIRAVKAMKLPPMRGKKVAVLSRSGGHAVISADACVKYGFDMISFPDSFLEAIRGMYITRVITHQNPLDLGEIFDYTIFTSILEEALKLDEIDGILFNHLYQAEYEAEMSRTFLDSVDKLVKKYKKPVMVTMISDAEELLDIKKNHPLPVFSTPNDAAHALFISAQYHERKTQRDNRGTENHSIIDLSRIREFLLQSKYRQRQPLLHENLEMCAMAGIRSVRGKRIFTIDELQDVSIGFPLAAKLVSSDASHKSDADGVKLSINDYDELSDMIAEMKISLESYLPGADFSGVYVHEMATAGAEFFVGARRDPVFGPIVMTGMGGIFVELYRDVAICLAPVTIHEAWDMVQSLKSYPLFQGFRGKPPLDAQSLVDVIMRVSELVTGVNAIHEIDLNPVFVYDEGKGSTVVDCRIFLQDAATVDLITS